MSKIQINFASEIVNTVCPSNLETFKNLVCRKYFLERPDVEELIIYYINENDRIVISNEEDYKVALSQITKERLPNSEVFTFFLEINEKSRLYQIQMESVVIDKKRQEAEQEALKNEMERKEKEMLEQERLKIEEIKRKEMQRQEEELKEKERLLKDKVDLNETIQRIVTEAVGKQIEVLKEELLSKSVLEKEKKLPEINELNKTVHNGFTCDGCAKGPIEGVRYRCTTCFNFDLCEECEKKDVHPVDHPLIKHKTEQKSFNFFGRCWPGPRRYHHDGVKKDKWVNRDHRESYANQFKNYGMLIGKMREKYDLKSFNEGQIVTALDKACGDIDQAIAFLF